MYTRAGLADGKLRHVPEVEVEIQLTCSEMYYQLGYYAEAEPLVRSALETVRQKWGVKHDLLADATRGLGQVLVAQGRFAEAEALLGAELSRLMALHGGEHASLALSMRFLAEATHLAGRYAEAERLARRALSMQKRLLGDDDENIELALSCLLYTADAADDLICVELVGPGLQ